MHNGWAMDQTNHRLKALEYVESATTAIHAIHDLRDLPAPSPAAASDRAIQINRAYEDVHRALKLADVHAQLSIGQQLEQLHARVDFLLAERVRP